MTTPNGTWALMHANGTPFADILRMVREEAVREYEDAQVPVINGQPCCSGME